MSSNFWRNKIKAFLHDPLDKIIRIPKHEKRRDSILKSAKVGRLRRDTTEGKCIKKSDEWASSLQRIDLEKSIDGRNLSSQFFKIHDDRHIFVGDPVLRHPISGEIKEYYCISNYFPKAEPMLYDEKNSQQREYEKEFDTKINEILDIEKEIFAQIVDKYNLDIANDTKKAYFEIWATYSTRMKNKLRKFGISDDFENLTAYTLSPDHTLLDHADATSAIYGAMRYDAIVNGSPNDNRVALMMFKISPVHDFIKNARKERDLWAGSHLLSYLTFKAITVVADKYGPDAIIFPHLRDQALFNWWIKNDMGIKACDIKNIELATIPNKFMAIVPFEHISKIKEDINIKIKKEIENIFNFVIGKIYGDLDDKDLLLIIYNHFRITMEAVPQPFTTLADNREESYRKLKEFVKSLDLPPATKNKYFDWIDLLGSLDVSGNRAQPLDMYSLMFEILIELVNIKSAEFEKIEENPGWKCTLCGEHTAIFGEDNRKMKDFWNKMHKNAPLLFRNKEKLCPLCLMKRMYHKYIQDKFGINKIGFDSVSDIALKKKISGKKITWRHIGEFIRDEDNLSEEDKRNIEKIVGSDTLNELRHNVNKLIDELNKIPKLENKSLKFDIELLYKENLSSKKAVANTLGINDEYLNKLENMDDRIKKIRKLIEEIGRIIGEPEKYYSILMMDGDQIGRLLSGEDMKPVAEYLHTDLPTHLKPEISEKALRTKRLITPAAHAAISRSMKNFSLEYAINIIKQQNNGELIYTGGDDILALLPVDTVLKAAYELERQFEKSWDGWRLLPGRTMSAGILIVHYKHPLYDALDKARKLLKKAKDSGRKAVAIGYLARSGTYRRGVIGWEGISGLTILANIMKGDGSRMIYEVIENMKKLPNNYDAVYEYIKYEAERHFYDKNIAESIMETAKHVRLEYFDYEDGNSEEILKAINNSIRDGKDICDEILNLISDNKNIREIYGYVLKNQIESLFQLIKIAIDCDTEVLS